MLYAEIKKSSEYASQRSYHLDGKGKFVPFPVKINSDNVVHGLGAVKGGIGGNYHLRDVILYVKDEDGKFVKVR